jgi:outer membrane protein assembly factor BamB
MDIRHVILPTMPARTSIALVALIVGATALSGCTKLAQNFLGGVDNTEKPAELTVIEPNGISIDKIWTADVGSGSDKQYLRLTPVLANEQIFAADAEGRIASFSAQTGEQAWQTDTEVNITGGPGTDGLVVVVGSDDGDVIALEAVDGTPRWRTRVSSEVLAAPKVADNTVVVRTIDGKLYGLDAADGKLRWSYDRSVPVLTLRGTSAPVISRGIIVAGFDGGQLAAVSLDNGQPIWEVRLAVPRGRSEVERLVDIDAPPIIADSTVYAVTFQGRVAALDLLSGEVLWRRDLSSHIGLSLDDDHVYVADAKSHLWALDRSNSSSLWRQSKLQARNITSPAVNGAFVVVGDLDGYVHWLSTEDGRQIARTQVGGGAILAAPIVAGDRVFVYSSDGTLAALRLNSGS